MARYYRKIIRVVAESSPNVKLGLAQRAAGMEPTGEVLIEGVLPWADYVKRRATWDPVRQCIGLDAEFWEGADALLFPPEWLNRAEKLADAIAPMKRVALGMGVDSAEGGDNTAWCITDNFGVIHLAAMRTPDTTVITAKTLHYMRAYSIPADRVCFDRGGGGKVHADRLRSQGHNVRTVAFGQVIAPPITRINRRPVFAKRLSQDEDRYVYKTRRAEMYGELRVRMDPTTPGPGFGIPREYAELRRQMALIPLTYDPEGRLYIIPKEKKPNSDSKQPTLREILGCSPDETDALVLACHAMTNRTIQGRVGRL